MGKLVFALIALLFFGMAPSPAAAQAFPSRAVRWIVPFPAGGATDPLARLIAERLAANWKQPVLVENRPGASTAIGTDLVAKSAPDGHVLGMVTFAHVINPLLGANLPYDTLRDLTGVMQMTQLHMALYARRDLEAGTPAELFALARRNPEKIQYGAATPAAYLVMELLNMMAGVKMEHIPYKGSGLALTDLVAGRLMLVIDPVLATTLQFVKEGRIKLIGTLGTRRAELTPDTPVVADAVPGFNFTTSFGLVAQGRTPPELVRRIRDDVARVLNLPEVRARIRELGQEPVASTAEEYNAFIRAEMKRWEPVVKATGAKMN
ncbi:MAG: tripartite tricarboxylate transporter substrate binding protein [Burkholderiales bacterium]|nr:tripartite tricarboxylate transporter substrate binding protein [Burkholderiales bacterium]